MLVLFMGPTACGKTSLLNALCERDETFTPVVRVTTRTPRPGEVDGKDYCFVSQNEYRSLLKSGRLIESEEYSGGRFYGTSKSALLSISENHCSTITPSGLLQICNSGEFFGTIILVYCYCSLGTQIIRYVSRTKDFSVSDKMEMCDRLARDEGMFKGIDAIIQNAVNTYNGKFHSVALNTDMFDVDAGYNYISEYITCLKSTPEEPTEEQDLKFYVLNKRNNS